MPPVTSQCSLEALQGPQEAVPFSSHQEIQLQPKISNLSNLNRSQPDFNLDSLIPELLVRQRHLELVQVPSNSGHLPLRHLQLLHLITAVKNSSNIF